MSTQEIIQIPNTTHGLEITICGNEEVMRAETIPAIEAANNAIFNQCGGYLNVNSEFSEWNGGIYHTSSKYNYMDKWDDGIFVTYYTMDEDGDWQLTEPNEEHLEAESKILPSVAEAYNNQIESNTISHE